MFNYILIKEDNFDDFKGILAPGLTLSPERIILGCYDDEGLVLGGMSFILSAVEYEMDWLYVIPERRRAGVAKGLMDQLFDFIRRTGEVYPLRAQFEVTDEDRSLYDFFLTIDGMDTVFSHHRYYVDHHDISKSEELKKDPLVQFDERFFLKLSRQDQEMILEKTEGDGIYVVEDPENWKKCCVPELCRVMYLEGEVKGAVFVLWRKDGNLEFSYLFSSNPVCTKKLVSVTARDIKRYYSGCSLVFDAVVPQTEKMAGKSFPGADTVNIYQTEWY